MFNENNKTKVHHKQGFWQQKTNAFGRIQMKEGIKKTGRWPIQKDFILLCGPDDDLVPNHGHKLCLAENQHISREVLFMKQCRATDAMDKERRFLEGS